MEYLPYILDALIIILPLISIIVGLVKGFTGLVLPFAITLGMIIIARLYAPRIALYLCDNYVHDEAVKRLAEYLGEKLSQGASTLSGALPQAASELISGAGFSADSLISAETIPEFSEKIITAAEPAVIIPGLKIIIYIGFYTASKILGCILVKPVNAVAKLPLIKEVNKTLGVAAGAVLGAFRCIALAGATAVAITFAPESAFAAAVSDTHILSLITREIINIF